jgi:hypothetical protein
MRRSAQNTRAPGCERLRERRQLEADARVVGGEGRGLEEGERALQVSHRQRRGGAPDASAPGAAAAAAAAAGEHGARECVAQMEVRNRGVVGGARAERLESLRCGAERSDCSLALSRRSSSTSATATARLAAVLLAQPQAQHAVRQQVVRQLQLAHVPHIRLRVATLEALRGGAAHVRGCSILAQLPGGAARRRRLAWQGQHRSMKQGAHEEGQRHTFVRNAVSQAAAIAVWKAAKQSHSQKRTADAWRAPNCG